MATMDELIEEILAEYELSFIFDQPIPEDEERRLPRPLRPKRPFTDLDDQVPPSVRLPADQWVEILNDAKDKFEVDGASAVFSTWRVEEDDLLDIGDIEVANGMHARAGRLALNARMTDVRATQLLAALPEGNFQILSFSVRKMMIGSLRTSLIQSELSERRARGSSRSLGTQK